MEERQIRNDIVAIALLAFTVFLVAALATYDPADQVANLFPTMDRVYQPDQLVFPANEEIQNACGRIGAWTSAFLFNALGVGAYYLVIALISLEVALFRTQYVAAPWLRTIGWTLSLIGITALAALLVPSNSLTPIIGAGGYLGALGGGLLKLNMGSVGSVVIALTIAMTGMMMWTEYLVFRAGRLMFAPALVAASKVLPFGLLHGFFTWFNTVGEDEEEYDEDAEFAADDIGALGEVEGLEYDEEDEPRTIRFRRRDLRDDEEEEDLEADDELVAEDDSDEEYEAEEEYEEGEEEPDEEPVDEYEEEEDEAPATIPLVRKGTEDPAAQEEVEEAPAAATVASSVPSKPHFKMPKPAPKSERDEVMEQLNAADQIPGSAQYKLPSIELLSRSKAIPFEEQKREALKQARILEKTYKEFGLDVKVVEIETGPVISQYELQLASGLRLNKVTALADDLAIALRVPSVRIVAPIPGKNTVGVEVPNPTRQMVKLREVMEQCEKQIEKYKVPLFLGKDSVGAPMVVDLAALPHLLIAGRTGTGKSVCLNSIISSILMTRRPDEVRMLMIDPKMVELSGYGRLPHLMHPVVTDMKKAEAILAWAVEKMEDRYRLLAKAGVRHLTSYNQLSHEELIERLEPENDAERKAIPSHLPFIIIVADEMADLMMTAGKEVEQHIIRLAQKSRAVGIHLVLATQKPTVDVITGLIKSNLPARLAFQVASKMDSRVVLDASGADKLLGMGDMLFLKPGTSTLLRGQGTFLSDDEIDMITQEVSTGEQNFVNELVNLKIEDKEGKEETEAKSVKKRDELYEEAIEVIVTSGRGSGSLLQRALGMGYGRAARVIDWMEEDGIVGPYSGSKAREVLMSVAEWEAIKAGGGLEAMNSGDDAMPSDAAEDVQPHVPLAAVTPANTVSAMAMNEVETANAPDVEGEEEDDEYEDDEPASLQSDDEEYEDDEDYEYEDVDDEEEFEEEEEVDVAEEDEEYEDEGEDFVDDDYDPDEYEDVD